MDEIDRAARETVDAARNGDQNAIAMLAGVRRAAKAGVKKSQVAYEKMMKYTKATTTVPPSAMAAHGETSTAIVPVSNTSISINRKAVATTGIGSLIGFYIGGPPGAIIGGGIGYLYQKYVF